MMVTQRNVSQPITVRSAAILTNSYVAGTVVGPTPSALRDNSTVTNCNPLDFNALIILADFTKGSLTDAQIKVECSWELGANGTYYQESSESVSTGVSTISPKVYLLGATGLYYIVVPNVTAPYVKISAIGTGTVTSSSLAIKAVMTVL